MDDIRKMFEAMIKNAGFEVAKGGSWESDQTLYISSLECWQDGEPKALMNLNKLSGWVQTWGCGVKDFRIAM